MCVLPPHQHLSFHRLSGSILPLLTEGGSQIALGIYGVSWHLSSKLQTLVAIGKPTAVFRMEYLIHADCERVHIRSSAVFTAPTCLWCHEMANACHV